MALSPKSASLAERFKGRNSSALIELARSRNSYLSKARPAVNKANKRFVVVPIPVDSNWPVSYS